MAETHMAYSWIRTRVRMMDIVVVVVGVGRIIFGLVVLRMAVVDWPSDAWLSSEMSVFLEMRYRGRF